MPDASLTSEFIEAEMGGRVDPHDQLVLYLPGPDSLDVVARRLVEAGVGRRASRF